MTPAMEWLGCVDYAEALERQRARREAVLQGDQPEVLWLLEHPPVVTLGRRGGEVSHAVAPVVRTERGGLATWHGPGQLVGYPILHLHQRRWAVRRVVEGIEAGLMDWLATVGVQAGRRAGAPGVWVAQRKIGALGLHIRRGVTMHGFALNLELGPAAFAGVSACGFGSDAVTSVQREGGGQHAAEDVAHDVGLAVLLAVQRCAGTAT